MSRFIQRNWKLNEEKDFEKNVLPKMFGMETATSVHFEDGTVAGWKIKPMYE